MFIQAFIILMKEYNNFCFILRKQKHTFATVKEYILDTQQGVCYIMLTYNTNDNRDDPISLSEVYCNIFYNTKIFRYNWNKRHACILIIRLMHTFLTLDVSLLFVTLISFLLL